VQHEPKFYDLPQHLQRVFDGPEFAAALKEANKTVEEFRSAVEKELKALTQEQRREELKNYEELLGAAALHNALERFKGYVGDALKTLHAKHRSEELSAHEAKMASHALAKAKGKAA
jgi:hypothetical protein